MGTHPFDKIQTELTNLPGEKAHLELYPTRVSSDEIIQKGLNYRLSAVLILVYLDQGIPHFILTQRHDYNGQHSGQISFPGGKVEPSDETTKHTALRETEEELGVSPTLVNIRGQLTDVFIPVSQFLIHPYLGTLDQLPPLSPNQREVKEVIHCSVHDLLTDSNLITTKIQLQNGMTMKDVPAFKLQDKIVWGATAVILNEFKFILRRIYS